MRVFIGSLAVICLLCLSSAARASETPASVSLASLVADTIAVTPQSKLVAEGNVFVVFDRRILRAKRITYDRQTDDLTIDGPIRLEDGDDIIIVADQAVLDTKLQNGLLYSARIVLAQQLQLATRQIKRVSGRYTQMDNATASSCQICTENGVPLWQIRARRVVHDTETKQLYFTDAQLRFGGIPVLYLPRLRMPDPTLKRARGFLLPRGKSNTLVGYGFKLPYFIPMGDHKDLTLTPYITSKTKTMEFRYRQKFHNGDVNMTGALTSDTLVKNKARGYIFGDGTFNLKRDYKLSFDIEAVMDEAYLSDYTVSPKDRLDSSVSVERTRKNKYFSAELLNYDSLRPTEDNASLPRFILDLTEERRFFQSQAGGEARLLLEAHTHIRASKTDIIGRDVTRAHAELSWRRRWTLPRGLRMGVVGRLNFDAYTYAQDSAFNKTIAKANPEVAIDMRWPLKKITATKAYELFEPVLQLSWSGNRQPNIRIDESTLSEFDEGNLLSLSRFTAPDQREHDSRAAIGMRWLHNDPKGWASGLVLGQIIRGTKESASGFSAISGLNSRYSDILVAGQIKNDTGLILLVRGLMGTKANVEKIEADATWQRNRGRIWTSYISLPNDSDENRSRTLSEWSLNTGYYLSDHWHSEGNIRYDLSADRTATAGLSLTYENECVQARFEISRRFASSTNLTPSTDLSLGVDLRGFGLSGSDTSYTRTCRSN